MGVGAAGERALRAVEDSGELLADEGHRDVQSLEPLAEDSDDIDARIRVKNLLSALEERVGEQSS